MAADSEFTPVVTRLGCLRGVSTLTAFGPAVEIGDWHRFDGRAGGAYLGLVPTESSSGGTTPGRRTAELPGAASHYGLPARIWLMISKAILSASGQGSEENDDLAVP